ncbi:MAG: hypothetical protein KC432_13450, partial [Thermomicrobiales bacterium]|nr:hypothetical protein [Thermomicrobiales bacterium]
SGQNSFLARYGATILRGGIAAIPAALFRFQAELGLKPQQVWFISAILSHKWDANMPHPSLKRMSEQTGVSRRQLHNYQRQLVELGLLDIVNRQTAAGGKDTNYYDFSALFEQLEDRLAHDRTDPASSSHTHGNPSSHTHAQPSSHRDGKARSHLKKNQEPESEKEESVDFEHSKVRKVQTRTGKESTPTPEAPRSGASSDSETKRGAESVGDVLARQGRTPQRSQPRDEVLDEDYQRIQDHIADRAREFNDTAPLKSSTTRAWNLYQASGLSIEQFVERIFQARSLTQEGTARIKKTAADTEYGVRRKTKMAYFFAVLEDQLGLSEKADQQKGGERKPPPTSRSGPDDDYRAYIQT